MNGTTCPHCSQINPESQKTCERCGQSLLWSTVGQRPARLFSLPKPALYALMGIALGLSAAHFSPSHRTHPVPPPVAVTAPRIDVVFAIDSTGSMGDEIEVVKSKVSRMMNEIQSGNPKPDVRFGLVAYRDHGDAYLTKVYPLTSAVETIQTSLAQIEAGGGGDTPEAVAEGLNSAVNEMNWDGDPNTTRMIFLIGDAGPHFRDDFRQPVLDAKAKGIKINTWGCSGLQDCGQQEFSDIALLGGGQFQFLTYQQEVVRKDGSRARLVFQGKDTYEVSTEARWAEGADAVAEKRHVDSGMVSAPGASGGASYKSAAYSPVNARMENNLDTVLVRQVQDEARKKGVAY
ncbi:VWA domain-containing protein [bacterium]|nr:VWA domain-containing protein [bacterium]